MASITDILIMVRTQGSMNIPKKFVLCGRNNDIRFLSKSSVIFLLAFQVSPHFDKFIQFLFGFFKYRWNFRKLLSNNNKSKVYILFFQCIHGLKESIWIFVKFPS